MWELLGWLDSLFVWVVTWLWIVVAVGILGVGLVSAVWGWLKG